MQNDALIRGVFKVDPTKLKDKEWTTLAAEAIWYLKFTGAIQDKENQ